MDTQGRIAAPIYANLTAGSSGKNSTRMRSINFPKSVQSLSVRSTLTSAAIVLIAALLSGGNYAAETYRLEVAKKPLNVIGTDQRAVLLNGTFPGPTLHWREGDTVSLEVYNGLQEPTSIHWHGIVLPYEMDGVPGISFPGIAPGETFTYRFQVKQNGTYWYHGHSGFQEQLGLFGALVIDPIHNHHAADRDYVVLLSDWPVADPDRTMARLKKQSDYYNFQKRTVFDFFHDAARNGLSATLEDRLAWGEMRMEPTDLADVTGATYRFLINGQTSEQNWTALFKPGETVRLRFINASAMTHFDVRIPQLKMRIIAADGQDIDPVAIDEFRIAVAETYDVLVEPQSEQAYSIFAEAMDRSGYARATLTPRSGLQAAVPEMRPRTLLTLADMGALHGGHAAHAAQSGQNAAADDHMPEHAGHAPAATAVDNAVRLEEQQHAYATDKTAANRQEENNHAIHDQHSAAAAGQHQAMTSGDMASMHEHHMLASAHQGHTATAAAEPYKTLDYQDLQAAKAAFDWGAPDREITLRLTGNMYRYIWSFDDVKYSASEPIRVRFGEHLRIRYVNETMMNHPIHLHGLWQYLDNGKGLHNPKKHVINVKPGTTATVHVIADALGEWAFHCHLLYHMDTGMFRKLIVEPAEHNP